MGAQLISNLRSDPGYCLNVEVKLVQVGSFVDLIAHGDDQVLNALLGQHQRETAQTLGNLLVERDVGGALEFLEEILEQVGLIDETLVVDQNLGELLEQLGQQVHKLLNDFVLLVGKSTLDNWIDALDNDGRVRVGYFEHEALTGHGVDVSALFVALQHLGGKLGNDVLEVCLSQFSGDFGETLDGLALHFGRLVIQLLQVGSNGLGLEIGIDVPVG